MTDPTSITFAELQHLMVEWQAKIPVIYYGDTDAVARGETYECRPLDDDPFLVVHPDDLVILREQLPNVRFVHLRDKPPLTRAAERVGQ